MFMRWPGRRTFPVLASLQAAVRGSVRRYRICTGRDRWHQPALGLGQYTQLGQPCLQPPALSLQSYRLLTSSTAAPGAGRSPGRTATAATAATAAGDNDSSNQASSSSSSDDNGDHGDVNNKASTPLARILHSDILYSGPVTVADYMRQCLTHPLHGYYTTTTSSRIFGRRGDFVTAPQVSAVFSELLGVWLAAYLRAVGGRFRLVEFGPGCGILQRAMLPTLAKLGCVPESVHLVDASETLRDKQKEMLGVGMEDVDVRWYTSTDELMADLEAEGDDHDGEGTGKSSSNTETTGRERERGIKMETKPIRTMFIAHEFFDALPVHIFQRVASASSNTQPIGSPLSPPSSSSSSSSSAISAWREMLIDIDPSTTTSASSQTPQRESEASKHDNHRLRAVLSKGVTPATALLSPTSAGGFVHPKSGEDVIEVCAQGLSLARRMARLVARECDGGAALIVDYGGMQRRGMTLRAISRHAQNLPFLTRPGEVDLTADVDFGALQRAAEEEAETHARFHGAVTQRDFLLRMGIAQRMRNVAKHIIDTGLRTTVAEGEGEGEDEIKRRRKKKVEEEEVDRKLSRLQSDYDRLVGTTEQDMGVVYKVAAICGRDVKSLPGFE